MKWKMGILSLLALVLQGRSVFILGSARLSFDKQKTVHAELLYQGSGQVSGRWEVTRPAQSQAEEIQHFDAFLPPSGRITLAGPEWARLPQDAQGAYAIHLQVERVVDKGGPAEIRMVGATPVLRYWVGQEPAMALTSPEDGAAVPESAAELRFETGSHALYRLEITDPLEHPVLKVLLPGGATSYRLPSWMAGKLGAARAMNWRLTALSDSGELESSTTWWTLALTR